MRDNGRRLPLQQALFEDQPETNASALVVVTTSEGPPSAAQRTFNRLTERIRRGRESLAAWEAFIPRFHGRVAAELQPIEHEVGAAQRRLAQQLHALLAGTNGERPNRKHRARVRSLLLHVVDNLLQDGPDAELEALYNRYGDISYAERRRQDVDIAEVLFGQMLGPDVMRGHEARNVDELAGHATEKIAGAEAWLRDASTRCARRRGPGGAAKRKAQAAQEASVSVREIYRKLASALHPDRETDAVERERKTVLIQRANQAYARNDLLELLALQIETEQIDAAALSKVPEARLRHYNQVLADQATALEAEVQGRAAFFRIEFDLTTRDVTPQRVDQALTVRIAQVRAVLEQIKRDSARLDDPRQRPPSSTNCPIRKRTRLTSRTWPCLRLC
ncbi:MAG: J domain-containing protein, partial [Burkholderiales bacterium]